MAVLLAFIGEHGTVSLETEGEKRPTGVILCFFF